jgi:hypothetical protein
MASLMRILLAGGVIIVALMAALRLMLGFRLYLRYRRREEFEPYEEINPPEPVARTMAVSLVGYLGILWSAANLAVLAGAVVILRGQPLLTSVAMWVALMVYGLVATMLVGWGGMLLLRLFAYGRRALAWGIALFGIMAVFFFGLCLFLRTFRDTPEDLRPLMLPAAGILAAHTVIGTAIGVAAQHVGLTDQTAADASGGRAR